MMIKNVFYIMVTITLATYLLAPVYESMIDSPQRKMPLAKTHYTSSTSKVWQAESNLIPRNYLQQPPLIPHAIEGYQIDRRFNKCLSCHDWNRYMQTGATKISLTHFVDRNGVGLSTIDNRRFFCNQCHVPQNDAKLLVNNTFIPINKLAYK